MYYLVTLYFLFLRWPFVCYWFVGVSWCFEPWHPNFLTIYLIWKIKTYNSEIIKWHLFSMTEIWFFVKAVYCKIKRKFFMPLIFVASGSQVYLKCFHSSMQLHSGVIFNFFGHYNTFNNRSIKNSDYHSYKLIV